MYLDEIYTPSDLRALSRDELTSVCDELRNLILKVVSEKGGHFASNLGTVELTVLLHYVFNTPHDKIVWDVGHQAYGHKILTGRKDRIHTIREFQGLSGFTCRSESEYDPFGAAHASTSISAAIGIAEGMRHRGKNDMAIAVIGDGSLTGGLAYEAMNNAGHLPVKNLIVILNDNEMSIDQNIGALKKFIHRTITNENYNRFRREIQLLLKVLSNRGIELKGIVSTARKSLKNFFSPGMLFECLGFRYFGPINGHDINELNDTFSFIKKEGIERGPYFVHVRTVKGKGYQPAEGNPIKYHGVNPFKIEDGLTGGASKKISYQDVFADTLIRLANEDLRIVAITAAMPSGTGLSKFQKEIPNRFYDVGIAEAHAVLFAAGLATEGFRPVCAIYSTFLQRAYDQVIHDVAIQNLPVIFAMDRAGLVGNDGATHQGAFDLSYLRAIPQMVIMAPKDENELQHMLKTAVSHEGGPIAVRYPRGEVVGVQLDKVLNEIPIGEGELLSADGESLDMLFLAVGYSVQSAKEAARLLRLRGFRIAVINARFIKPLDETLILRWIAQTTLVVTIEENSVLGGFGSAVLELMSRHEIHRETLVLGLPDTFIEHASQKIQREMTRLDPEGIAAEAYKKFKTTTIIDSRENIEVGAILTH